VAKTRLIQELVKKKPYLIWHTKNYEHLSERSIVENVLNYGSWEDYLFLEKVLGVKQLRGFFEDIKNKKRTNLRPQTINYFSNYFGKYA